MNIEQKIEDEILPKLTQETCKLLNLKKKDLSELNWQTGESNLDTDFSNLAKKCCESAFKKINEIKELSLKIDITDLKLKFKYKKKIINKKIELKTSKTNTLPGGTKRTLDINQWTICCKRSKKIDEFELKYGRYYLGMKVTDRDLLQDRSPRPQLNFQNFQDPTESPKKEKREETPDWIPHYANAAINRVLNPKDYSWQDDLIKKIIKEVLKNPKKFKDI